MLIFGRVKESVYFFNRLLFNLVKIHKFKSQTELNE
jgi:hypothetical protein